MSTRENRVHSNPEVHDAAIDAAKYPDESVALGWFTTRARQLGFEFERDQAKTLVNHARDIAQRNGSGRAGLDPADEDWDLSDSGNADRLAHLSGHQLHYVPPWAKWLVCGADGFWTLDHGDVRVRELAKAVGRELRCAAAHIDGDRRSQEVFKFGTRSLNAHAITGMVNLARGLDGIPADHEALDADPWLLGVANGVLNLASNPPCHVRRATPGDLLTLRSPIAWDPDARAPRWDQALEEWFPDEDVRRYVRRVAGSAMVGAQREHVFVIHYGTGRNGKGTFARAIQRVLGPYATVIHLALLEETRYRGHDTIKAELFRKRLAIASETGRRTRLDEASVKNLTGGDRITARRMREDPWEFDPTHSLWLQTNHLPQISGRDTGIWSRIRVVKWESTFEGDAQDQTLDDTLASEAPGILRWLVDGCRDWQRHGLDEPEAVVRETMAYRQAEDVFTRFRTDTGLLFRPNLEMRPEELMKLLEEWADEEGIDVPTQDVGDWLRDHGVVKKQRREPDGSRPRYWIGIGTAGHESEQTFAL